MLTRMKSLALGAAATAYMSTPFQAFAQLNPNPENPAGNAEVDLKTWILNVTKAVLNFVTLIAVVVVIIAGIRFIISQGEEQEKEKARKMIVYAIIGLVIILLARAIVAFVVDVAWGD